MLFKKNKLDVDSEKAEQSEQIESTQFASAKKRKRKVRTFKMLLWFFIAVVIVYMSANVIIISVPDIQYQTAIQDTMVDYMTVTGFIDLKTVPVNNSGGSGYLYYTAQKGERVSEGQSIASVYAHRSDIDNKNIEDRLSSEINMLSSLRHTQIELGDAQEYSKQVQLNLYNVLGSLQSKDLSSMATDKENLTLAFNRLQLSTDVQIDLDSRINTLSQQMLAHENTAEPISNVISPATGYFTQSPINNFIPINSELLAEASTEELQKLLDENQAYYGEDIIGHIVTDYKWNFYTVVPASEVKRFEKGQKLEIFFPDTGSASMPVEVTNIIFEEGAQYAKIEIYCEYMGSDILTLRKENAQLIFDTQKGIRVDKEALRIVDGEKGVYIKYGNVVRFRKIDILLEDANYMLVRPYEKGVSDLQMYDDIIVKSGGEELYDGKKI